MVRLNASQVFHKSYQVVALFLGSYFPSQFLYFKYTFNAKNVNRKIGYYRRLCFTQNLITNSWNIDTTIVNDMNARTILHIVLFVVE